jgi:DNA polymerase-3 subunit gamma/tau
MQLHEQYRPRTWEEVVGQDEAIAEVRRVLRRSWGGRSWWLTGLSGTGKTTIARLIAAEGADEFGTEELDASRLTPAKVEELRRNMSYRSMSGKGGKAYLVNEAHGLRRDTIRELLVLLEDLPEHVSFIFTTTKAGQASLFEDSEDTAPLLSRCHVLELSSSPETRAAMAARAKAIAMKEGIDGLPDQTYREALEAAGGNMRKLLQRVESGSFAKDAKQRQGWKRELELLASTKGERAESRRAELKRLLGE